MRGKESTQQSFFSYIMPENRVPHDHPLRPIKQMVNTALTELSTHFSRVYSSMGRPSIPPEMLLRATLLQILYSIRSERLLMEQLDYNILFRWFVGLSMDDAVWDHSVFSKNRERLLNTDVAAAFFVSVRQQAEAARLLSDEHFTVDGTLIEAWASLKSFRPKDDGDLPVGAPQDLYRGGEPAPDGIIWPRHVLEGVGVYDLPLSLDDPGVAACGDDEGEHAGRDHQDQ